MEKAYKIFIDAPHSESNSILNFWKVRPADPRLSDYISRRVEKNRRRVNELYRKAVDLNIEQMEEDGDQYARARFGWMYSMGLGVDENYSTAVI